MRRRGRQRYPRRRRPGVRAGQRRLVTLAAVPVAELIGQSAGPPVSKLGTLHPADLLVVAPRTLPASALSDIRKLPGVTAANLLDAARIEVNGGEVATLGVEPSTFREFAAKPTAKSTMLWQNVADGGIAISYLMGQQEKLPLGGSVTVVGARTEQLPVGGFGTVGISGVDAVVSDPVATLARDARPGNAIVISAPNARLSTLMRKIAHVLPKDASVAPLVAQAAERGLLSHGRLGWRRRRHCFRRAGPDVAQNQAS